MSRYQAYIGIVLTILVVNVAMAVDDVHLTTVTGMVMGGAVGLVWAAFGQART